MMERKLRESYAMLLAEEKLKLSELCFFSLAILEDKAWWLLRVC